MSEKEEQQNKLVGTWNSRQHKTTGKDDEISQNLCLDTVSGKTALLL